MSTQATLAFIGTGNMARAILGGLLENGYPADKIYATARNTDKLADLAEQGVHTTSDNPAAIAAADVVILAVKPQMLQPLCKALAADIQARQPLVVSVAAGVMAVDLERWLGGNLPIVRCMPNTPSLVQTGASGLYANAQVTDAQRSQAGELMAAVGMSLWVESEAEMDALTAVSGSGPAYYFLFMEAMIAAGQKLGLSESLSRQLTLQTALGAAKMANSSEHDPAELRRRVTSPNGTTERAIQHFQAENLEQTVADAMTACRDRSAELAQLLAADQD